ncbi:30S ribosomal protein S17 [Candidatus Giovannonibacteria bacterium RIFCSPLOWO2_12_FULL_44_25]|uniref:Small ribosomal subunit protein uS17 n=3 Tax=Parcubacteria group TaxID=1794811 RepID=A0A837IQQ0_9BACT|nr:MAG: 30S ribosomal protein S17 [Parcubacteria group bacterium GW2011_GWC1_44_10]KKT60173.1 MAG: 30S ribosomal protein S17 [Candidatus Giovannonibacteria bacterium GW2011_GWA1_44_25]KKU12380.1 MAG: 30S ribosomal protein S17 [Candidatus Azambacteria bacterium GW2011_GWC2_45_7b]KKU30020.1 MAG: 30S ribosomal protein S17 [Candidatus Giovannonibacteria bacterium GW2011_GWB1_46_20]OGF49377.1 MAG: 30S ribosomal protein S17 [Candidatus Giovannonibacteria bacterium GWA2_45_15]OGF59836.1 MAG: 30S ribo
MAQELKGKVVSNKMEKTAIVEVSRLKKHPIYGKYTKVSKRFKAHAEENIPEGKTVIIQSTRPMSKDKKWKIIKVL